MRRYFGWATLGLALGAGCTDTLDLGTVPSAGTRGTATSAGDSGANDGLGRGESASGGTSGTATNAEDGGAGARGEPPAQGGDAQGGDGRGGDGRGGDGPAGEGGQAPLSCSPEDMRVLKISCDPRSFEVFPPVEGDDEYTLEYDSSGRLEKVDGLPYPNDGLPYPCPYVYNYDTQGRIVDVGSEQTDGAGYSVSYQSESTVYQSDDMSNPPAIEASGKYWLRSYERNYSKVPTWSDGLIAKITVDDVDDSRDSVTTFSYDVDALGHPIRLIPSTGSKPLTEEFYDAAGHHLFQLLRADDGTPLEVGLYRDNSAPVRSLLASIYPRDLLDNGWLWAAFDPAGVRGVVRVGWVSALDLLAWRPLSLSPAEAVDFAVDLDGDDKPDVSGDYEFDAEGRLVSFVLQLNGEDRVAVNLSYTPKVVTESVTYPNGAQPAETRVYHYGCLSAK